MSKHSLSLSIILLPLLVSSALAQGGVECKATFKKDTPAKEDPSSVVKAGTARGYATQYVINNKTNKRYVCFHGGYCYLAQNIQLSCKVDWKSGDGNSAEEETIYYFKH